MLDIQNITKKYKEKEIIKGISLSFREKEFACILGTSGVGKTTLLNCIGRLDSPTTGSILLEGIPIHTIQEDTYRNHSIGFVFQNYQVLENYTVYENIELPLSISNEHKRKQRVKEVMKEVGLEPFQNQLVSELSGGQKQRVAIARALINNPKIILADEPTGALDEENALIIIELLKKISKNKLVIMVTHNKELAHQYATREITIQEGKVVSDTNPYQENTLTKKVSNKKVHLSLKDKLKLAFTNLKTKPIRTLLLAIALSIGLTGILLTTSFREGFTKEVNEIESFFLERAPIYVKDLDSSDPILKKYSLKESITLKEDTYVYKTKKILEENYTFIGDTSLETFQVYNSYQEGLTNYYVLKSDATYSLEEGTYTKESTSIQGDTYLFFNSIQDRESLKKELSSYEVIDEVSTTMDTIKQVVEMISFILLVFSSLLLGVTSFMMSIILYMSVLERQKEIGILRSIGSRKKDIASIFKVEASLIGILSSIISILVVYLLRIPINQIVYNSLEINNLIHPSLSLEVFLVVIGLLLMRISALIPAKIASNKKPIDCLRTA